MAKKKTTKSVMEEEMDAIKNEIEQGRIDVVAEQSTPEVCEQVVEAVEMAAPAPEQEREVVTLSSETAPIIEKCVFPQPQVKEVVDESLEVYNLIRAGYSMPEIRTMCARWKEKKFKSVYARACALIAQSVKDLETAKAEAICRYNDLYQKSYKNGNLKGCKEIQDSLCKVQGITKDLAIQAEFVTAFK